MQDLTAAHIEIIADEVSKDGITLSHLRDELIDHICCQVEAAMRQGLSFDAAFKKTKDLIGHKGLKKVQEDTLLLINKKYRIMKKTMKTFGLVSMAMVTIGALFKIQHWPGASILLTLGFFLLATVFIPSALWVLKKESKLKGSLFIYILAIFGCVVFTFGFLFKIQHWPGAGMLLTIGFLFIGFLMIPAMLITKLRNPEEKNLHTAYIIGALSLMFFLTGDLFKIQHWPGAGIMLVVGAIGLTTIFFPVYVTKAYKKAETIKASFLFLCVGIVFFNLFNILLALNVSKNVLGFFIKPGIEIMKTSSILENKSNKSVENILNDALITDTLFKANIKKAKTTADELCVYIEKIKTEIISEVDGFNDKETIEKSRNIASIIGKDKYMTPSNILCGTLPDGSNGKASELKKKLLQCNEILLNLCKADENAQLIISRALETKTSEEINVDGKPLSWEMDNFYHLLTIAAIDKLSYIERNIRIAETEAVESLISEYQEKSLGHL